MTPLEITKLREANGFLPPKGDDIQLYEKGHVGEPAYHLGRAVAYDPTGFLGHITLDELIGYDRSVNWREKESEDDKLDYENHMKTFKSDIERVLSKFGPDFKLRASGG